jgi:dCMP deaminase
MNSTQWHIPTWDELFMRDAYNWASKSKDTSTKIGAVIVKDNIPLMHGYNGIPRKVRDDIPERNERPEKYYYYEHAERNAFFNCARKGIATEGATMYCIASPCAECARGIINSGITKLIIHKQWDDVGILKFYSRWKESFDRSLIMFNEAEVEVKILDCKLNVQTMINGDVYIV